MNDCQIQHAFQLFTLMGCIQVVIHYYSIDFLPHRAHGTGDRTHGLEKYLSQLPGDLLDSGKNKVWMYRGSGINYVVAPAPFFDESIPDLGGAIDLAVDQEEIYILNADGHMITCQYGENKNLKKTACQDPTPFTDARLGREKSPWIFLDSHFISMQVTHLPSSSVFVLDDANRAVFQLSYQLNLEAIINTWPTEKIINWLKNRK